MLPFLIPILLFTTCNTQAPILNASFYNVSSASGLYSLENTACGGLVGWTVSAIFFVVIFIIATYYSEIGPGLLVGGGVSVILSVLLQYVGINNSGMPILFGGLALLGLIITVLKGILQPYN